MFVPGGLSWYGPENFQLRTDTEVDPTDTFDETFIQQVNVEVMQHGLSHIYRHIMLFMYTYKYHMRFLLTGEYAELPYSLHVWPTLQDSEYVYKLSCSNILEYFGLALIGHGMDICIFAVHRCRWHSHCCGRTIRYQRR